MHGIDFSCFAPLGFISARLVFCTACGVGFFFGNGINQDMVCMITIGESNIIERMSCTTCSSGAIALNSTENETYDSQLANLRSRARPEPTSVLEWCTGNIHRRIQW
jgi:hypothetical protein